MIGNAERRCAPVPTIQRMASINRRESPPCLAGVTVLSKAVGFDGGPLNIAQKPPAVIYRQRNEAANPGSRDLPCRPCRPTNQQVQKVTQFASEPVKQMESNSHAYMQAFPTNWGQSLYFFWAVWLDRLRGKT